MSYTELDKQREKEPARSAYKAAFYKEHYKQVKFYAVTKTYIAIDTNGEHHILEPSDRLFPREPRSAYFTCPARNLTNLLIPKPLLKRKAFWRRSKFHISGHYQQTKHHAHNHHRWNPTSQTRSLASPSRRRSPPRP